MSEIIWDNIRPTEAARVVSDRSPYQQGRDEERAAIVSLVRDLAAAIRAAYADAPAPDHEASAVVGALDGLASSIEAGVHLRPPR